MTTLHQLEESRENLWREIRGIQKRAKSEGRPCSQAEEARMDDLSLEATGLTDQIHDYLQDAPKVPLNGWGGGSSAPPSRGGPAMEDVTYWRASDGDTVPVIGPRASLVEFAARTHPNPSGVDIRQLSAGRMIQASIVGDWSNAPLEREFMSAMGTGVNTAGGYLVPSPLSARVIDLARARSVLMRAGAKIIPMTSDTLRVARVAGDPTMEVKEENAAFTSSSVTLDEITFNAHTIGSLIDASRELAADAPNFASLIEMVLANALAVEIDRLGLRGTGSQEPVGIINFSGVGSVSVGGAISYEDLLDGIEDVEAANHEPNAYALHPTISRDLAGLLTNSEVNHFARPPMEVEELTKLKTTGITTANAIVGDFQQFLVGMRQEIMIETTVEGQNRFDKHQLGIKVTTRLDFGAEHDDAFSVLSGITT